MSNNQSIFENYLKSREMESVSFKTIAIFDTSETMLKYMKRHNLQNILNRLVAMGGTDGVEIYSEQPNDFIKLPTLTLSNVDKYVRTNLQDQSNYPKASVYSDIFNVTEYTNVIWITQGDLDDFIEQIKKTRSKNVFWNLVGIKARPLDTNATIPKNVTLMHIPQLASLPSPTFYRKICNKFMQYISKTDIATEGRVRIAMMEDRSNSIGTISGSKHSIKSLNLGERIKIGIGWSMKDGEVTTDIKDDAVSSALVLKDDKLDNINDLVFFGNKSLHSESESSISIVSYSDTRDLPTSDMEQYTINLKELEKHTLMSLKVLFTLTLPPGQHMDMLESLHIRLLTYNNKEVLRYSGDLSSVTSNNSIELGSIYLYANEWKFNAIGHGYVGGLDTLGQGYGIENLSQYYLIDPNDEKSYENGRDFEYYMQDIFQKLGYDTEMPTSDPFASDYGVDLIITKGTVRTAVQLKCYSNVVPIKSVQEVYAGMRMYNCSKALVVATNYFSKQAVDLARTVDVELWDKEYLDGVRNSLKNQIKLPSNSPLNFHLMWENSSNEEVLDLDLSAFLLDVTSKCTYDEDFVFFNQTTHTSGCMELTTSEESNETSEELMVNLSLIPPHVTKIAVVGSLDRRDVKPDRITLLMDDGVELYHTFEYKPASTANTLILGYMQKVHGVWMFIVSNEVMTGGLEEACSKFGIQLT